MSTIFSDFDGVLFDSVKEAYLLARCAFWGIDVKSTVDEKEYKKFRKFRYLITKSWQFYYIYKLIKNGVSDNIFEEEYNKCLQNIDKQKVNEFDMAYVKAREDLMKSDYNFWDNLDTPFDFFFKAKELSEKYNHNFIVLTNKKKLPVQNKLKKFGFNAKLYANEDLQKYSSKYEFIQEYMKANKINESYFIEDSIDNLKECENCDSIKGLLAGWGYVSPKEKGYSQEQLFEIIKTF